MAGQEQRNQSGTLTDDLVEQARILFDAIEKHDPETARPALHILIAAGVFVEIPTQRNEILIKQSTIHQNNR